MSDEEGGEGNKLAPELGGLHKKKLENEMIESLFENKHFLERSYYLLRKDPSTLDRLKESKWVRGHLIEVVGDDNQDPRKRVLSARLIGVLGLKDFNAVRVLGKARGESNIVWENTIGDVRVNISLGSEALMSLTLLFEDDDFKKSVLSEISGKGESSIKQRVQLVSGLHPTMLNPAEQGEVDKFQQFLSGEE